jgi:hypothetical protein
VLDDTVHLWDLCLSLLNASEINSMRIRVSFKMILWHSLLRFSMIKYINQTVLSSWCCVNMILSEARSNEITVSFSFRWSWIFHHQSSELIWLYILWSFFYACLTDEYVRLCSNDLYLIKNCITCITLW